MAALEPKASAQERFSKELQESFNGTVWKGGNNNTIIIIIIMNDNDYFINQVTYTVYILQCIINVSIIMQYTHTHTYIYIYIYTN